MGKQSQYDWGKEYTQWRASGETQAGYCKSRGLKFTAFKNGIYRARNLQKKTEMPRMAKASRFVPVGITEMQTSYCEIRFGNGSRITIDRPEAIAELGRLMRGLKNA